MVFIITLSIVLSLANARTEENTLAVLPSSRKQTEKLADKVCNDLGFLFFDKESRLACPGNFFSPSMDTAHRTEVKVRCRSKESIHIEVMPLSNFQLVVLVPMTAGDNEPIKYTTILPLKKLGQINNLTSSLNYAMFSTALNFNVRPAVWHSQAKIHAWSEEPVPEHRPYDVKVMFGNVSSKAVVTWNHTGDSDVCFAITNMCGNNSKQEKEVWPDQKPLLVFENLPHEAQCTVEVKGFYGATQLEYHTLPRKMSNKEISKAIMPKNITLDAVEDGDVWKVTVEWLKPRITPEGYKLTLRSNDVITMEVSGNVTKAIFTDVTGEGLFNASIVAFKRQNEAHNFGRAIFPPRVYSYWRWASAAGGAWGLVAVGLLISALCWRRHRHGGTRITQHKGQETKPLDENLEVLETECEDQWEVKCEKLVLHEVIGEGAFGVVRRGSLAPNNKQVAVKMLKVFPSLDEVRAFRLEMELMKSVGAHPHVVSLVGCCSGKRPLIIAEYCARGDLLSFLRCSWDVMVSKRHAKYSNNNVNTSDYRNDLFKCNIQREPLDSTLVVNKMYDLQGMSDSDLTSLDLLSFCRQIAMGMKFLASNRVVHRDLAARNVLVTADRTLKIADFGLSRDVYEENQYKQKGNGKMPVKWMALESLTRRIYMSQSDVWSFGVVMWEIVTVGGAPYPEVPAARLPRLLRAGYRMPRPPNCSKQLYELMLSCWRAHPRERPTFSELHQRLDSLLNSACADQYLCLELDDTAPPLPRAHRYLHIIMRGKRAWGRETYERPLKAIQGNHNHYTSPPVTLSKAPV